MASPFTALVFVRAAVHKCGGAFFASRLLFPRSARGSAPRKDILKLVIASEAISTRPYPLPHS